MLFGNSWKTKKLYRINMTQYLFIQYKKKICFYRQNVQINKNFLNKINEIFKKYMIKFKIYISLSLKSVHKFFNKTSQILINYGIYMIIYILLLVKKKNYLKSNFLFILFLNTSKLFYLYIYK